MCEGAGVEVADGVNNILRDGIGKSVAESCTWMPCLRLSI